MKDYKYQSLFGNTNISMQDYKTLIFDTHGPWLIVTSYVVKPYSSASVGMMVWYLLLVNR